MPASAIHRIHGVTATQVQSTVVTGHLNPQLKHVTGGDGHTGSHIPLCPQKQITAHPKRPVNAFSASSGPSHLRSLSLKGGTERTIGGKHGTKVNRPVPADFACDLGAVTLTLRHPTGTAHSTASTSFSHHKPPTRLSALNPTKDAKTPW
jgi:hypothetical protein